MPRDRIAEITKVRERAVLADSMLPIVALVDLEAVWNRNEIDAAEFHVPVQTWAIFSVMRCVTFLEVFVRGWTATLIDRGAPYAENAAKLDAAKKAKFDFALSRAIQGKQLSIGEIIAHEISVNCLSDIVGVFTTLAGNDLFCR